jgi:hypothetical protein
MPDSITISHAQEVVSHLSQLTENQYSSIVAAANDTEKEKLKKTAIGPRMADLKPDQVTLVGADDKKITQQELVDTFNRELTKNGGAELTEGQKKYLWEKSIVVIKDPGESANPANSPATVPDSSPAAPTPTRPEPVAPTPPEDTAAPTLSSSSPSNAAKNIARNSNIDITFSENIRLADAAKVKLFKKDGSEVQIDTSVEGEKTLRIKPKTDLEASTEYYVTIDPAAITDTSEKKNAYAGITANTGLSFTTAAKSVTPQEQAPVNQAAAKKNKPVLTPSPASEVAGSNGFNKPVTKLNLDADDAKQSAGEKKLEKLVNLRYGLDLLESKDDVHVALGAEEESYVNDALASLRNSTAPDSQIDNGSFDEYQDGETPNRLEGFVLRQAIEEYKKINKTEAEKAEAARDKKINEMTQDEKLALTRVFENYQKKFTKLKDGITEDKLKKYLTDNYDTLKDLGIDDFPADIAGIKGKNKDELITLAVAARNKLNRKISEEFENITISPEDKKAFLKKYTDIDFSDSGKSIEFIKGLTDNELLLFNKWNRNGSFYSRDFIIRELSQHKLSLDSYFQLSTLSLSDDADLISFTDRENLLKKYDPKNTDLNKKKEFIQGLTPEELVMFSNNSNKGFISKQSILSELDKAENKGKSLKDIFDVTQYELGSDYLDALKSKEPSEILGKLKAMQSILKNSPLKIIDNSTANPYTNIDNKPGHLYMLKGAYLVDFDDGKPPKFYKSQEELLGLPAEITDRNQFLWLANERRDIIGYDTASESIYSTSLLRLSQNAGRLKTPGVTDGSNQINTLHTILEKIYASEEKALGTKEETTKWHQEMKRRVAKLLMSSSDDEFVKNRQEFQKYLNDTYSGIDGWNIFHIDGWRKEFNHADGQTEDMLGEVRDLLANAHDSKAPASP